MAYPIAKRIVAPLAKALWIKEIKGVSNLPKEDPFIFACNHGSFIDDLLLPVVLCPYLNKHVHLYCNDKFFKNFFTRTFIEWGGVIPIRVYKDKDQKKINKKAFELALGYLKKSEPVGIFPEGHRTRDGKLQKARSGVAALALKAKVPIVPIGTIGTYKIWPKGAKLPNLNKCTVNIGKPLYFKSGDKEKITRDVMKGIAKLSNKVYSF